MPTVGLLHPGAMGATIGRAVRGEVLWCPEGRSAATRRRARAWEGVPLDELPARADVVLSVCPPAFAEDVAGSVRGFAGVFVDANAISPMRSVRLGAMFGERFVDGGIIGGAGGHVSLYLCGPRAAEVGTLFAGDVEAIDLGPEIGRASRLKMAFAHYQKGSRALAAASHALAAEAGLTDHLLTEARRITVAALAAPDELSSVAARAWRWGPEMLEIAATLEAAGLPGDLARGAAAAFARWEPDKDTELPVETVLEQLRA
jgi:3-hydroxyisobutyrate dehydrogenase-like beta-hydroxyacid dehydrogenase